jgi:hypothetical protein
MSIFDKRVAFKPFEYPEITEYKDAINHSYWLVSEFNFLSDIHGRDHPLQRRQAAQGQPGRLHALVYRGRRRG